MANIKLYKYNPLYTTYYASGSTDASYPLTNLNSFYSADYWKSANSTNGQYLRMLDTTSSKTFCIIDNSNIQAIVTAGGRVYLASSNDPAFGSGITTIKRWETAYDTFSRVTTFTSNSHQYFRIYYEVLASIVPYVGNFWVGIELDLGVPYAYPFQSGLKQYQTSEAIALNGCIRSSQAYSGGRKYWKLPLKTLSTTIQGYFNTFFDAVRGKGCPFYFLDTDGTTLDFVSFDMDENPLLTAQVNYADGEITMKTIEVS